MLREKNVKMKCEKCGRKITAERYFQTKLVCEKCFTKLRWKSYQGRCKEKLKMN